MERPFPTYKRDEPHIFMDYAHDDVEITYSEMIWIRAMITC